MANEYRVSTETLEALYTPATSARVSTETLEVLYTPPVSARVSTETLEVLYTFGGATIVNPVLFIIT